MSLWFAGAFAETNNRRGERFGRRLAPDSCASAKQHLENNCAVSPRNSAALHPQKVRQSCGGGAVSDTVSLTTGGASAMGYGANAGVMLFRGESDNGATVCAVTSPRRGTPGRFGLTPQKSTNPITSQPMRRGTPEPEDVAGQQRASGEPRVVDIANVFGHAHPGRRQEFSSPSSWGGAGIRRQERDPYAPPADGSVRARSADGAPRPLAYGSLHPKDEPTALYPHHRREEIPIMSGSHKRKIEPEHHQPAVRLSAAARFYEFKNRRASSAEPVVAPFATDVNNDAPSPIFQKKKVPPPTGRRLRTDEDAFLLKTSRTPPAGAKALQCTEEEGFAVLFSTDPGRNRAPLSGGRMVSNEVGKGQSDFVQRSNAARTTREATLLVERQRRCASAYTAEQERMENRKTRDFNFMTSKNRSHTPGSHGPYPTPWALNLSAPHMASVGKQTPRWKR